MGQILVYENGNAIGGEGHPTYARDITFENEGTDLVSEQTNDAIVEVNAKTKHGFVELWLNSSSGTFAGQAVQITTDKQIDSFLIEFGDSDSKGALLVESEKTGSMSYTTITSGYIAVFKRTLGCVKSGNVYTITFSDNSSTVYRFGQTTSTTATENDYNKPIRILGIIHE